ncbi:hypothetical protein [Desulforhopalus singaporensis]|nr:hypothetical protein [Desulforhopalus singaporensis]
MDFIKMLLIVLSVQLGVSACSNPEDEPPIQEKAAMIGEQAAESIKSPIEKAKLAKKLSEQHSKELKQAAEQ